MSEENVPPPSEDRPPPNHEAGLTRPTEIEGVKPQEPPPEESESHKQSGMRVSVLQWIEKAQLIWKNRWIQWIFRGLKNLFLFGTAIVSLLWAFALWDSYRPKITVTPGPTFNAKDPLATMFIVQNQGALRIQEVSFDVTWTYADANQARNVLRGWTKIPELQSLEQHALINPLPNNAVTNTSQALQTTEIKQMPVANHSLVLWFDVTFDPQFFGKRTNTLFFFGSWDSETNFQWLPTGHVDIRSESPDAALVKRAMDLQRDIERKRASQMTNNASTNSNSRQTNGSSTTPTNGGSQVHTN